METLPARAAGEDPPVPPSGVELRPQPPVIPKESAAIRTSRFFFTLGPLSSAGCKYSPHPFLAAGCPPRLRADPYPSAGLHSPLFRPYAKPILSVRTKLSSATATPARWMLVMCVHRTWLVGPGGRAAGQQSCTFGHPI